jgi:hypothetical protein
LREVSDASGVAPGYGHEVDVHYTLVPSGFALVVDTFCLSRHLLALPLHRLGVVQVQEVDVIGSRQCPHIEADFGYLGLVNDVHRSPPVSITVKTMRARKNPEIKMRAAILRPPSRQEGEVI